MKRSSLVKPKTTLTIAEKDDKSEVDIVDIPLTMRCFPRGSLNNLYIGTEDGLLYCSTKAIVDKWLLAASVNK